MKRTLVSAVGAIALSLVIAAPGDAIHAYGGRPHWRATQRERPITIIDSVTTKWDFSLRDGAGDWSLSPEVNMQVIRSNTTQTTRRRCAYAERAIHVCNYPYGRTLGWAGLAQFTFNGEGHITTARIRLNDSTTGGLPVGVLAAVACHELGHTLGLGHYRDPQPPDSCMRTPARVGGPQDPSAHDYSEVTVGHGHVDGALSTSAPASNPYHDDPYVRVRRDGDLTHVTFILPA